jgi:predicted HicB family RNase H-like nuclease
MTKTDKIDLNKLTPEARKKVERAIKPRDTSFSLRFNQEDIDAWHAAAAKEDMTITDWVQEALDDWAGR